ncbi:hypothetical protein Raf01_14100 [Rugosimonospora africana]|uniref:Uncharacterized protein n=1 Tax=Rugosimonospora africana TaxID=556532 RepID=A0A8J3QPU6_9ACTN|nr:hypothetical protein Raf01_14100 [Rugosimonospora africana]
MHSARRRSPRLVPEQSSNGGAPLPLRWAVIILAAGVVGFSIDSIAGLVPAITAAATVVGLLHQVLP